jgi:hypothetical protein
MGPQRVVAPRGLKGLGQRPFQILAGVAWGVFLLFTAAFPIVAFAIMKVTDCAGVGGACGAVAVIASLYLKPVGYLVFVAILAWAVSARLRRFGVAWAWVILLITALLPDTVFAVLFGAHWGARFALGGLPPPMPAGLIVGFASTVFLALVADDSPTPRRPWLQITVAVGLVLMFFASSWLVLGRHLGLPKSVSWNVHVTLQHLRPWCAATIVFAFIAAAMGLGAAEKPTRRGERLPG